jgi:hypothetical protein
MEHGRDRAAAPSIRQGFGSRFPGLGPAHDFDLRQGLKGENLSVGSPRSNRRSPSDAPRGVLIRGKPTEPMRGVHCKRCMTQKYPLRVLMTSYDLL